MRKLFASLTLAAASAFLFYGSVMPGYKSFCDAGTQFRPAYESQTYQSAIKTARAKFCSSALRTKA